MSADEWTVDYLEWVIRSAITYDSLLVWHDDQPMLFPNDPFGWFDDTTPLHEDPEGYGRGGRPELVH